MTVYAIGDVQGCYESLMTLLDHISFNAQHDILWFAGDLVNRGPKNLETLRFVKSLGDQAVVVLGNHDLHLLAMTAHCRSPKPSDTFHDILDADDSYELLDWLRKRPVVHHDAVLGYTLIHAGLPPQWDLAVTLSCAHELEFVLAGSDYKLFFEKMYGDQPDVWSPALKGDDRLRFIVNCLTRMRYCDTSGRMNLDETGPPGSQPKPYLPWFQIPNRASRDMRIICGHWSALSYYNSDNVYSIDTGCVWGRRLTALRLDDNPPQKISITCPDSISRDG